MSSENSPAAAPPAPVFSEAALAETLGVTHKTLAKKRRQALQEGADFELLGNVVALSRRGLGRLLEALNLKGHVDQAALEAALVLQEEQKTAARLAPIEGTVKRFFHNPHLMGLQLDNGDELRVRVRSTKHFKPGMRVPVKLDPGDTLHTLARKEPRAYGRW